MEEAEACKTLNRPKIEEEAEACKTLKRSAEIRKKITGEGGGGDEQWRDWASMTDSLLQFILSLLTTLEDFSSFRSVCKNWRSVAIPNRENLLRQSPLLLHHSAPHTKTLCDLAEMRRYAYPLPKGLFIIGYSHGCIIAGPVAPPFIIFLYHIITGKISRLPLSTDSRPGHVLLSAPPSSPACIAVLVGNGPKIIYCRIGDPHWTELSLCSRDVQSVVFFQGRLHFLTDCGDLGVVDFEPQQRDTFLEASKPDAEISISEDDVRMTYLAESGGDLLLVNVRDGLHMFHDRSNLGGYRIWRWDFQGGHGLVKVTSLGEWALFIGYSRSVVASVSASVVSGVRGNCIYHTHYGLGNGSRDGWTVYSLEDKTLSDVHPESFDFAEDDLRMPPVWIFPSLC